MARIRILIADGNVLADRAVFTRTGGCAPSGIFDRLLRSGRSDIETEILFPTDESARSRFPLGGYDGILITGSRSNIYKREPETLRQIEFARAAFASGTPMFGVCWGLQLATVAMGGEVARSRAGRTCEVPFATGVRLTEEGRAHPMHVSRPDIFDSFSFHSDEVTRLPENATMTAFNRNFIQAAEIRGGGSIFWGVQYHPEASGRDMAGFLRGCIGDLIAGERYRHSAEVEAAALAVSQFDRYAQIPEENRFHFDEIDVSRFEFRPLEITNWIERLVIPSKDKRNRGGLQHQGNAV